MTRAHAQHVAQRLVTAAWLVISILIVNGLAQTPAPQGTASVSGRLTLDGRPFINARVVLASTPDRSGDPGEALQHLMEAPGEIRKATTDSEGRYRFSDIAAG